MAAVWGQGLPPRDLRRIDVPERPVPGRKDRARWCRGKAGVEHRYEVVVHRNWWPCAERAEWLVATLERDFDRRIPLYWSTVCAHTLACSVCGKRSGTGVELVDCPDLGVEVRDRVRRLLLERSGTA